MQNTTYSSLVRKKRKPDAPVDVSSCEGLALLMLALWVTQTRRAWWWRRPRLRDWGLDEGSEWYELLQPKAVIGVEKAALRYREELGEILTAMQDKKSVQARFGQACVLRVEALRFQWHHLHDRPFLQNACRIERDLRLVDLWDEDVLLILAQAER